MNRPLTFNDDQLGLDAFAQRFERYLLVEHDYVDGSLVAALDAPFGSGKSTFLSMWSANLLARRSKDGELPAVISLNSWQDDFCGDPLVSLATGFIRALSQGGADQPSRGKKIREAVSDIASFGLLLGSDAVASVTGLNPVAVGEKLGERKRARSAKPDLVRLYEERTKALEDLRQALREAFGGEAPKAFVLVDELDRCRPDFAIHYSETIKHVFNIDGLVFVLAVDYNQLAGSARALFGTDLNVAGYFRRFFHRRVTLPKPQPQGLQKLAETYASQYLSIAEKRGSFMDLSQSFRHIPRLVTALRLNPREIQEVFRTLGHVNAVAPGKRLGHLLWGIAALTVLFACLRVANPNMYENLGSGTAAPKDLASFLASILPDNDAKWWFCVYFVGGSTNDPRRHDVAATMYAFSWIKNSTQDEVQQAFAGFGQGFDYHSGDITKFIYRQLESLATLESPVREF